MTLVEAISEAADELAVSTSFGMRLTGELEAVKLAMIEFGGIPALEAMMRNSALEGISVAVLLGIKTAKLLNRKAA